MEDGGKKMILDILFQAKPRQLDRKYWNYKHPKMYDFSQALKTKTCN